MMNLPEKCYLLVAGIAGTALVLAFLILRNLGGAMPVLAPVIGSQKPLARFQADDQPKRLFARETLQQVQGQTNSQSAFYTAFFQPPPPAPPKRTRKVELTYQGFFETTEGDKRAYLLVGTNLVIGPLGSKVVADLTVADIALAALTLRNTSTQQTVLLFRTKTELEVPLE